MKYYSEKGFTLLELIISLLVTSILLRISMPSFQRLINRVNSAAAKTSITNIKKECTINKDLEVQEFFTPIKTTGYSLRPISSLSCLGDMQTNLVSLIPDKKDNPIYTYSHLSENINKINPSIIKKETFLKKSYPTGVSWLSCANNHAHRFTGANV